MPAFTHVFVIVMENQEYGTVIGNSAAPYINSLATSYGLGTQYYAVTHPSLPNYLALTAGSTFGITTDCTTCYLNSTNLADQIEASGRTWKAYMESMPSACFTGSSYPYMQKHDPWMYYDDIRTNLARCQSHVVPYSQFATDMASGNVPNFVWITPNMCSDTHDCSVATGDAWLAQQVPTILNSAAWLNGGVLFITWDEGSTSAGCCTDATGGQVAMVVISSLGKAGLRSSVQETHYSLLRTIEDSWRLPRLNGAGCSCTAAMREYFN
jgi:acid phosphatase